MRFSKYLRQQADPMFEAIFAHPFVRGIANGDLSSEQLAHYVRQDFQYLNVFCQIYGLAIAKSSTREDMAFFHQRMTFILHSETHPHHNFAAVAGYKLEDLEHGELLPTSRNYTRHMLHVAHSGTLGELLAVLLPCPLTYWEIGRKLQQEVKSRRQPPLQAMDRFLRGVRQRGNQRVVPGTARRLRRASPRDGKGAHGGSFPHQLPDGIYVLGYGI